MQSHRTQFSFATRRQARQVLATRDDFVAHLSPFDCSARMRTARAVAEEEFLSFLAAQALTWPLDEVEQVRRALAAIAPRLAGVLHHLPGTILLVKTTGEEECHSAYTRRNAIILPPSKIGYAHGDLERLLVHELFHILSRHNPKLREALYRIVGFLPCGEIRLPETLRARRITNPDAPRFDHYILLQCDDALLAAVPVLYAREAAYDAERGGTLFDYLEFRLLTVWQGATGWSPAIHDGTPALLAVEQVPSFFEQVGHGAQNVTSPEEILAEGFAALVMGDRDVPSPEIADAMGRALWASPPE